MSQPLVSILVPTRDRRDFLPQLLRYVARQTWPADRLQVVIVDDGRDAVADLIPDDPRYVYEHMGDRVPLGTKRNRLCELSQGEILVHMDDDDWYPAERVQRAVEALEATGADIVGRSDMAFWDVASGAVHRVPLIGRKHATAGSMAYRRSYWQQQRWAPDPHTEERQFTRCFEANLAQLEGEPWDTVLCISHGHNTLPKNTGLPRLPVRLEDIITDPEDLAFYAGLAADDW